MFVDEKATGRVIYSIQSKEKSANMLRSAMRQLRAGVSTATFYFYVQAVIMYVNLRIIYYRNTYSKNATDDKILISQLGEERLVTDFLILRERMCYNPYQLEDIKKLFWSLFDSKRFRDLVGLSEDDWDYFCSDAFVDGVNQIYL